LSTIGPVLVKPESKTDLNKRHRFEILIDLSGTGKHERNMIIFIPLMIRELVDLVRPCS